MAKDMTQGNPTKILFLFVMPMLLGNFFQQLYNIADSVIVGNFVGPDALAIFSIIGLLSCRGILMLLQTPSNILEQSTLYLNIIFLGCTFQFLYNGITAVFNALGDSKIPLMCLVVSTLLNIVLDIVFVVNFNLGVAGVALATLIAQIVAALMNLCFLLIRLNKMKEIGKVAVFRKDILVMMFKFAVPTIFQQSIVSLGMMGVHFWKTINRYVYGSNGKCSSYRSRTEVFTSCFSVLHCNGNYVFS
ncbi:MAG: MATE family efflux transporter [Niameybacter sp.]|uniref:MATE family efflux transporter n=1 Tax=Niameybacter sp. TaxID=2033640 RepID=UPI002FC88969